MSGRVHTNEVTFNVRGGNDVITSFELGYNNDGGYFKNNELEQYDRYTFRTNVEGRLAKGLKLVSLFMAGMKIQFSQPGVQPGPLKELSPTTVA